MLTAPKVISVLGTDIQILFREAKNDPKLLSCVGYFDSSKHLIVVKILEPDATSLGDLERYQKEIIRHEIIHAFLYESGIDACSASAENWASNEEMVDWFAIQPPKIFKVFKEQGLV